MQLIPNIEQCRAAVRARPADPVARAQLAMALGDSAEGSRVTAQARDLIANSLRLGAIEIARDAAQRLFEGFGDAASAVLFAEALLHGGDSAAAATLLERIVREHPDTPAPRVRLAALALVDGAPETALSWVEPVATVDPDTRIVYVQTLLALGRHADAQDFATLSVGVHPETAELFQLLGAAHLARAAHDEAIAAFSEALRLNPDGPGVHYNLAIAFGLRGATPAALGVVDAGLERRANDPALVGLRDQLREQLLRWQDTH
jgi:tetratricopeptide (TPR) repeat protein